MAISSFSFALSINRNKQIEVKAAIDIEDYSECESAFKVENASDLMSALKSIVSEGKDSGYKGLWSTYLTAYKKDDGYIKDYYSNISKFTSANQDKGSGGNVEGEWYNREHSIPKSWWGGSTSNQGADPYIVVPADKCVNGKRGNKPYGYVTGKPTYSSANDYSMTGSADTSWGYSGNVFEPNDEVKGDLARSSLYAIVKYDVSQWTADGGSSIFSGNLNSQFGLTNYAIKIFTYWNNLDKPDDWEKGVNDRVSAIQKNRNPFIDHPEYVNVLFKGSQYLTTYETSGDDPVDPPVQEDKVLSSIEVTTLPSRTEYYVGDELNLTGMIVTAHYEEGDDEYVTNKVTVSPTTLNSTGTITITVSYTEGDITKTDTFTVTVTEEPVPIDEPGTLESLVIESKPSKTTYYVGEELNTAGLKVSACYSDQSTLDVTDKVTLSPTKFLTAGDKIKVTVRYSEKNISVQTSFNVKVIEEEEEEPVTPPTPPSTPTDNGGSSGGCKGNIETTSIILFSIAGVGLLALLFASIIHKKKKKIG